MPFPQTEGDPAKKLYKIEDDLTSTWIEDLAKSGTQQIDEYLAKHLAFLVYLDEVEPDKTPHLSVERPIIKTREHEIGRISLSTAEVVV